MNITHLILDVDGTLTDGGIYIGSDGTEFKKFQAKDGQVIRVLPRIGIHAVILTGRDSQLTNIRAEDLCISHVLQGVTDKAKSLSEFFSIHDINPIKVAYIGDDLNDYTAMSLCGFKACPADAAPEIKKVVDYVSPFPGGHGAVRDIVEKLLKNCGRWSELLATYGIKTIGLCSLRK